MALKRRAKDSVADPRFPPVKEEMECSAACGYAAELWVGDTAFCRVCASNYLADAAENGAAEVLNYE